jgi:isoleucyl-tRNA synthetase
MDFRQQALKALEEVKAVEGGIKNPLDAGIRATVPSGLMERLRPFSEELADLCGVSQLLLEEGPELELVVLDLRSEPRCERSWKRDGTVQLRSDGGLLSDRDAEVLGV